MRRDRIHKYVQSAKILLLPPKYEIIMVPSNHSFILAHKGDSEKITVTFRQRH